MSDARDRLAASRMAIVEHIHRRERRWGPRETDAQGRHGAHAGEPGDDEPPPLAGSGWFAHMQRALHTWWRYHPAHMAVDLATPLLRSYARRKPVQLLAVSAAAGALVTFARPWKLVPVTTLVFALLKSSQLSSLVAAAMSAADFRKDSEGPG
jgi:hypothetical protein